MKINEINSDIYILEYIDTDNKRDRLLFDKNQKGIMKSFVKEFKNNGTITMFVVDGDKKTKTLTKNIKYLSILKIVESYMKQEEENG